MAPPGGLRVAKPFAERVQSGKGKLIRGALALLLNWLVIAWWMHYRHHSMEAQRPVDVHKAPPHWWRWAMLAIRPPQNAW